MLLTNCICDKVSKGQITIMKCITLFVHNVLVLICNCDSDPLVLLMRNLFLLGVSPVKPVIVQDEAGEEPEQEVENGHDCTEHHFAIAFEDSREPDSKDDNVKDDAE